MLDEPSRATRSGTTTTTPPVPSSLPASTSRSRSTPFRNAGSGSTAKDAAVKALSAPKPSFTIEIVEDEELVTPTKKKATRVQSLVESESPSKKKGKEKAVSQAEDEEVDEEEPLSTPVAGSSSKRKAVAATGTGSSQKKKRKTASENDSAIALIEAGLQSLLS